MRNFLFLVGGLLLWLAAAAMAADLPDAMSSFLQRGERLAGENRLFEAIEEYRLALAAGEKDPEVYHRLSSLLYDVGLLAAAAVELEKALALVPDSDQLRLEAGVLHLAQGRAEEAEREIIAALGINPGSANAYFYLGEVFLRKKEYGMAWMAAKMAERLGHPSSELRRRLQPLAEEPALDPWPRAMGNFCLRQIVVADAAEAERLKQRLAAGELFEDLAAAESRDYTARFGGFAGCLEPASLRSPLAEALAAQEILGPPVAVETGEGVHLVQRLVPFDPGRWREALGQDSDEMQARSAPASGDNRYLVHVGSFREEAYAQRQVERLRSLGFQGFRYLFRSSRGDTLHGVVAGAFETQAQAEAVAAELKKHGFEIYISKN